MSIGCIEKLYSNLFEYDFFNRVLTFIKIKVINFNRKVFTSVNDFESSLEVVWYNAEGNLKCFYVVKFLVVYILFFLIISFTSVNIVLKK